MPEEELTVNCILKPSVVDRLAGLLILLEKVNPVDILLELESMRQLASELHAELIAVRGPWVVCMLCSPPQRLKSSDARHHDIEVHHAYRG